MGDGGAGWRARALKYAQVKGSDSGKEINIPSQEEESRGVAEQSESSTRKVKGGGWNDRDYLKDERHKMMMPSSSKDLKWKRSEGSPVQRSDTTADHAAPTTLPTIPNVPAGKDLNQLAAQVLKAKLAGDMELYDSLQKELEDAKKKQEEVVVPLDERGRPIPLTVQDQIPVTRKGKFENVDKYGNRVRYFRDDDVDLQTLVAREKLQGAENYDAHFAKNVINRPNYKVQQH